jgi:signal transduction histidine kinase
MRSFGRRPLTLAQRLVVLVGALALPLLVVVALSYNDQLRDRRAAEGASTTTAARDGAAVVESFLRDLENSTFAIASLLGASTLPLDQPTFGQFLSSVMKQYPEIRAYFLTDPSGRVVATGTGEGVGVDLSSRPYMVALKAGAPKVWSGSITGLQSAAITVAFGEPIRSARGETRGYVVTAFYPERVIEVLRPDYPPDARLVLIDETGRVIYDSGRKEPAASEIDVSGAPGVREALAGRTVPIDGVATPFAGEPQFGALVPIARTGWVMSIARPVAGLDAELASRLLSDVIAVIAALTAAALIATLIAARLGRPLLELSEVASGIARGERPMIPRSEGGGVEVERLAAAMRTMQGAVARREDELRLLAAAGESLSSSLDHADSLRRASRVAVPGFADWCVVDVMEGGVLARAAVATADPALEGLARELRDRFPPSQPSAESHGPIARAIISGAPVLMTQITDEFLAGVARHPDELELYRKLAPRSFIAMPLIAGDRILGAVTFITSGSGRHFTEDDFDLAKQLARRIALSIENARLFYEVQQSVRTRDDFLSAVAHELKTPLTVISASAQMLQRKQQREDSQAPPEPAITRILGSVARMTAFIEELLELVRRQADPSMGIRPTRFDLVELARAVVAEARQLAHGQELRVEADGPVVGEWDASRLERALSNLVGNAIKYNRPDGTVRVRVRVEQHDTAVIDVIDEGIGIPETDRARIFERFTRGGNVAGRIAGSGVGLAIVRQVVEQHRGSVEVASVEGRGSTFTIRLPLAAAPSPVPMETIGVAKQSDHSPSVR